MKHSLLLTAVFSSLLFVTPIFAATPTPTPSTTPTASAPVNPPDKAGICHLVLISVPEPKGGSGDCSQDIGFTLYLNAALDELIPYIMIIALIMIVFSGFQYMMSGMAGDVKAARSRIVGILGGIIFFFLIRLILNQVADGINLDSTSTPTQQQTQPATSTSTST